ncbi:hypothetical protein EBB07_32045 [Paenibacillaceae bacterium]|nr:hypothetical protein EBB07_32045 [Paenibacillaceae bacterium]
MSYQSLDLQMSVPRTPDASSLQSQMMQKPVTDQEKLAGELAKKTEELRHKNSELEHTVGLNVRDDQERAKDQRKKQGNREQLQERQEEAPVQHPYKGKHFDVTL